MAEQRDPQLLQISIADLGQQFKLDALCKERRSMLFETQRLEPGGEAVHLDSVRMARLFSRMMPSIAPPKTTDSQSPRRNPGC